MSDIKVGDKVEVKVPGLGGETLPWPYVVVDTRWHGLPHVIEVQDPHTSTCLRVVRDELIKVES